MGAIVALIMFGIPLGLIPAMIARSKGRSFVAWWFYGIFLFIIALVHALLLKPGAKEIEQQQAAEGLSSQYRPACAQQDEDRHQADRSSDHRPGPLDGILVNADFKARCAPQPS